MARKEYMVVDVVDILRRVRNGYSIRAVTRATGMDRNTLRKYLRLAYKKGFGRDGPCDLEAIAGEVVREVQSRPVRRGPLIRSSFPTGQRLHRGYRTIISL